MYNGVFDINDQDFIILLNFYDKQLIACCKIVLMVKTSSQNKLNHYNIWGGNMPP